MIRLATVAVLFVAVGCSNAPLAGSLDAIWPARGGADGEKRHGDRDRDPIVPDLRPDGRPTPPGPAPTDVLPPPADIVPGGKG